MQPTTLKSSQVELLNRLANEPAALAQMGYDFVDLTNFFKHAGNIALGSAEGVALFGELEPGVYEGHYLFSTKVRGKPALDFARSILDMMFTKYKARLIVGHTPMENKAARHFSRALGFTRQGTTTDEAGRPCVIYHLRAEQWVHSSAA